MNAEIMKICYDVYSILHNDSFEIAEDVLAQKEQLLNDTHIIFADMSNIDTIDLYYKNHNYYRSIQVKKISQVIDAVPVVCDEISEISPVLIIRKEDSLDLWCIIHEVCHLLSIAPYKKMNGFLAHSYGINEYIYSVNEKAIQLIHKKQHSGMNELLNDYAVWKIIQRLNIECAEPRYNMLFVFEEFINNLINDTTSVESFIGWYFSGNVSKIEQLLIGKQFVDYEDLYLFLSKQKSKKE